MFTNYTTVPHWCGRRDLNPYEIAPTRPSTLRVCQFRHFRNSFGADDRTRTGVPFLTMEVLYLLSYIGTGAVDEARTRNLRDGNAMLYQLSYYRWWAKQDSNLWPPACDADALPAELFARQLQSISGT